MDFLAKQITHRQHIHFNNTINKDNFEKPHIHLTNKKDTEI